ncbi:uncharacterized protein [Venturia canescens]|uniref:uncharacterized protein n=1 Tax=Venturia canescens TaxID=32260 RepID=UPI001C9BFBF3|nr:uncharacterized protein LOC122417849 [Venturia canescens]
MGEGRRERSSKRRHRSNLGIGKSSSDTEVVRSNVKGHRKVKSKTKEKWHFIEGLSVDELGRYRRRRVQGHPRDTLGTHEGLDSRENLVTEYRRAFRATSEDSLLKVFTKNAAEAPIERVETERKIIEPVADEPAPVASQLFKVNDSDQMETAVERTQNMGAANLPGRPPLMRRGTSLRREGDQFYAHTEYSSYVPHEGHHRADLARRPTSLRMEGNMGTTTEQCEKFIEWLNVSRPALIRLPTNLKLEGDLETTTESLDKYVPFVGARRPELLRQKANLKLEGDSTFLPEYTDVFRPHYLNERRMPVLPESHLQTGGSFYDATESCRINEPVDKDDLKDNALDEELRIRNEREEEKRRKKEDDMKVLVSKLEELKGPPLEVPEYKDAYKDFPRERPKLMRPEDEIGRADGSKIHPVQSPSKFPTKIDQDPEYNSTLLNMERPVYRKPPLSLKPSASASSSAFEGRATREFRGNEVTSEIRSQYVPYGNLPRVETLRMPANLRLEGDIDLQPEYREAYCAGRESSVANEPRMHRHRDRSLSASRRRDNLWITNNNGEQFGSVNAADEQDAFQVLNTRIHSENVVAKPPLENRRGSRLSHMQGPTYHRPTHLDLVNSSPNARNRSPSPYRLQVQNVDAESRGFPHRRPSLSQQYSEKPRAPSPDRLHDYDQQQRSYSPSFGRIPPRKEESDDQAFVVLDNARNDRLPDNRALENRASRPLVHQNFNPTGPTRGRPRNSTPTNWMPPWYDNTKTI